MLTPIEWALLFAAGLGGSAHCLAMCGVFAIGAARGGRGALGHFLPYTAGRLSAYFTLGLLAGLIGQPFRALVPAVSVQVVLSIGFGAIMVLAGLHLLGVVALPVPRYRARSGSLVARILQATLPPAGAAQALYLGIGNGLLPCPLIYGFLALATSTGMPMEGGLVMAVFGAGTVPALLVVALAGRAWRPGQGPGFLTRLRLAPGFALVALGLITAGRAGLLWQAAQHVGHAHVGM